MSMVQNKVFGCTSFVDPTAMDAKSTPKLYLWFMELNSPSYFIVALYYSVSFIITLFFFFASATNLMPSCFLKSFCFPKRTYNNFFMAPRARKKKQREGKEEAGKKWEMSSFEKKLKSLHIFAGWRGLKQRERRRATRLEKYRSGLS